MAREANAALQAKILQIGFVLGFLAMVVYAVRGMMFGSKANAGLIASAFVGLGAALLLDQRYWLMLPFLAVSGLSVPKLPFSGVELGCLFLIVVFFSRLALRRERPFRLDRDTLIVIPVILWMFVIWTLNPTGLAMFGSSTIGGRFYFDIAVGTMAFFALSTIRASENDARILFFVVLIAQLVVLIRGVVFPGPDPNALVFSGVEPERSARYAFIVCSSIFMLLFAYWPLSTILKSPFKILVFSALAILTIYSGKRRAFGTVAIIPFFRAFLTGRERFLTLIVAFLSVIFLAFAIVGDGMAYRLPRSARRALAVVVPKYRRSQDDGGINDLFRREMREQARYVIADNPWLGRKGFAMNLNETSWINFGGGRTTMFEGHAYAGNWHSTWYAYAADFGIPCMVLWAAFTLYVLAYAFHSSRFVVVGRYLPACCLYYACWLFVETAFSYTSGHSAHTTMKSFIAYGLLMALVRGYRCEQGIDAT